MSLFFFVLGKCHDQGKNGDDSESQGKPCLCVLAEGREEKEGNRAAKQVGCHAIRINHKETRKDKRTERRKTETARESVRVEQGRKQKIERETEESTV